MKFIPIAEPILGKEEAKLVLNCVKSTWISSTGEYIQKFEKNYAQFLGIKYATTCSNGTVALHLALLALGIGPQDEVIVPAFTFVASVNAITYVGAKPVFVDIDEHSWNMNSNLIEEKITKRTRAIMAVHLYGYPSDMGKILKIARKHKLYVIEDAAEAHGAKFRGTYVGTLGDIGCFSFYGNKIITTGEGGMVVTNKKNLLEKILLYKNHGMSKKRKYYHPVIGYNYRMTNLQAAIGYAQLKKINIFIKKRSLIDQLYKKLLEKTPGLQFQPKNHDIKPVCWLFSLLIMPSFGISRDMLIIYLRKHGIDSRPFFEPITSFPMYHSIEKFPRSFTVAKYGINLPSSPNLTTDQVTYIAQIINSAVKHI